MESVYSSSPYRELSNNTEFSEPLSKYESAFSIRSPSGSVTIFGTAQQSTLEAREKQNKAVSMRNASHEKHVLSANKMQEHELNEEEQTEHELNEEEQTEHERTSYCVKRFASSMLSLFKANNNSLTRLTIMY